MSKVQMIVLVSCVLVAAATLATLASDPADERPEPAPKGSATAPGRGVAPPYGSMSQKEIDEVMAFVKEYAPELHERLASLLQESPRRAQPLLRRMQGLYLYVRTYPPKVRAAAVNSHKLNLPIFRTVAQLRRATDPKEKEQLTGRLRELVAQRFDNDQVVKEYKIVGLEKRLADLKSELERRRENRQEIIDQAVKSMLATPHRPKPPGKSGPQK